MTTKAPAKKAKKKATPKPKLKGLSPSEKAEVFDSVAGIEDEIREGEAKMEALRSQFKGQRERVNGLKADLRQQLFEAAHPEATPLYAMASKPQTSEAPKPTAITDDESWKTVPLTEALQGLPKKVYTDLEAGQLKTLGDLAAFTAKDQGRQKLTDIAGIGEAAAKKIEEAAEAFWARRKKAAEQVAKVAAATEPSANGKANKATVADSTKAFLAADIGEILTHLGNEGPGVVNLLRADKIQTFGDIDKRAEKAGMPYLEVLKRVPGVSDPDALVKAITKYSESLNAVDAPEKAKGKGGKK